MDFISRTQIRLLDVSFVFMAWTFYYFAIIVFMYSSWQAHENMEHNLHAQIFCLDIFSINVNIYTFCIKNDTDEYTLKELNRVKLEWKQNMTKMFISTGMHLQATLKFVRSIFTFNHVDNDIQIFKKRFLDMSYAI